MNKIWEILKCFTRPFYQAENCEELCGLDSCYTTNNVTIPTKRNLLFGTFEFDIKFCFSRLSVTAVTGCTIFFGID